MPRGRNPVLTRDDAERQQDALDAGTLAAEAEAEAAEALAAAATARARAARLREQADRTRSAQDGDAHHAAPTESVATETETADPPDDVPEPASSSRNGLRLWRPSWRVVVAAVALVCAAAALVVVGLMTWHHREAVREQQQSAEYSAAARQIVYTLMAIDATRAQENVQQILDNTTGQFRDEFEDASQDFVKLAQDGKVATKVDVKGAAVETMSEDSAVVLVTATSTVTNAAGADNQPRAWRLAVDVVREGDRIKMSKMEFVP